MTDLPTPRPTPPGRLEFHHPVDVVRGLLAAAANRVEPAGDVELEIFAAWIELEEPGSPPEWVDADGIPGHASPEVILGMARNVLHAALLTLNTEAGVLPLVRAIVHLDAAAALLRGEAPTHQVPAW